MHRSMLDFGHMALPTDTRRLMQFSWYSTCQVLEVDWTRQAHQGFI